MKTKQISLFFAAAVFLAGLGIIGTQDLHDAQAAQAHYCEMVAEGSWPDFRGLADTECAELRNPADYDD